MRNLYLITTLGFPGSGKTYVAERLAKHINAVHLNSDRIRKELFENPKHTWYENKVVFNTMDYFTEELLQKDISVIYDGNLTKWVYRKRILEIAKRNSAQYLLLNVITPIDVALRRIETRHKEIGDDQAKLYPKVDPEHLYRIKGNNELPTDEEPHIDIDGQNDAREIINQILRRLAET